MEDGVGGDLGCFYEAQPAVAASGSSSLRTEIAELAGLSRSALSARWRVAFGRPAPRRLSGELMVLALAYQLQERALGGVSALARRKLEEIAERPRKDVGSRGDVGAQPSRGAGGGPPRSRRRASPSLAPGARLIREWRGRTYAVDVTDAGFELDGATFASLSAVARAITGVRWNGHLFFGLKRRTRR